MDNIKFATYGSVEVPKPTDSHGAVRRNPLHTDALVERPKAGIDTVTDTLFYNAREHGTRNALGWRDIVDMGKGLVELGLDKGQIFNIYAAIA